jgi:chemotaxis response regulator CheB
MVDDSALMRRQLTGLFQEEGDFLIHQARNGREAVEENRDFQPDVVTLDINMPEMDGITALSLIMAERPVPVVMVSSLTEKGALATFEALNLGPWITSPNRAARSPCPSARSARNWSARCARPPGAKLKGGSGPSAAWPSACARSAKSRRRARSRYAVASPAKVWW